MARMLLLLLLIVAQPTAAAGFTGRWDLVADGTVLFRFTVRHQRAGWRAEWVHPLRYRIGASSIGGVFGPAVRQTAKAVRVMGGGGLDLWFDDPDPARPMPPGMVPDRVQVRAIDANHLLAVFVGVPDGEFTLERARNGSHLGRWDSGRTYRRDIPRATDPEMTAIFQADQAARQPPHAIDWAVVGPQDRARRMRTQALLDADALASGDDFYHAAFVFQHGDTPEDHLKAHLFAMLALARGNADATWIAAATLDRYLRGIGQPQVLGTQFTVKDGRATQEPYTRGLMSDPLRTALGVPTLAEQERQRRGYEADTAGPTASPPPAPPSPPAQLFGR